MCKTQRLSRQGISLIEVLLTLTLLSFTILPYTLLVSQIATVSRGNYIQSSRSILLNSLLDEQDPERVDFTTAFDNNTVKNTFYSETGQVLPFLRRVDTSNSTGMKRVTNFYLYNNTADANTAAYYKSRVTQRVNNLRFKVGSAYYVVDSGNYYWQPLVGIYNSPDVVPGADASYSAETITATIDNVSTTDAPLFKNPVQTAGSEIAYSIPVESGAYTVKLYFAEAYHTDATRISDIYIEGNRVNTTPFCAWSMGGMGRASVRLYDAMLSDGVLNISVQKVSGNSPQMTAIQVLRRTS